MASGDAIATSVPKLTKLMYATVKAIMKKK